MPENLVQTPTTPSADNLAFGIKNVLIIRTKYPVRLEPYFGLHPKINKLLITNLIYSTFSPGWSRFRFRIPDINDHCPGIDKVSDRIQELENQIEATKMRMTLQRKEELMPRSTSKMLPTPKPKKVTTLRSAVQSAGVEVETSVDCAKVSSRATQTKVKNRKRGKREHQGNAKTFKRKTQRNVRL